MSSELSGPLAPRSAEFRDSPLLEPAIGVRNLDAGYIERRTVLKDITIDIPDGRITSIIGANGCGKSTLLKTIGGILSPAGGEIRIKGRNLADYRRRELAQRMSILPQSPTAPEGLTIRELVAFGRQPYHGLITRLTKTDEEAIGRAMEAADVSSFANTLLESLSGGQRQRAWIAMSLAQQAEIVLLDEPTTYLDIQNQTEVLRLLRRLNRDEGRTIVMVLHDLNQAARYSHHIVAMREGRVVTAGEPAAVMKESTIARVFNLDCHVIANPLDGSPLCLPLD